MITLRNIFLALGAYLFVALLVYGYVFNNQPPTVEAMGMVRKTTSVDRIGAGGIAALAWPMWVSVKLFEHKTENCK